MPAQGTAVIDFGAWPGSTEASVSVAGQGTILSTSAAEAWVMAEATADHSEGDHAYLPRFIALTCGPATAAVGFPINARSEHQMQGTFNLRWAWSG